mmetsp:Transcript_9427/g.17496  ORF Transcript_9427/g.17496 Transcript_9427/m.17496 type:complete len:118 (-) Transcript_9427:11-364(-)
MRGGVEDLVDGPEPCPGQAPFHCARRLRCALLLASLAEAVFEDETPATGPKLLREFEGRLKAFSYSENWKGRTAWPPDLDCVMIASRLDDGANAIVTIQQPIMRHAWRGHAQIHMRA